MGESHSREQHHCELNTGCKWRVGPALRELSTGCKWRVGPALRELNTGCKWRVGPALRELSTGCKWRVGPALSPDRPARWHLRPSRTAHRLQMAGGTRPTRTEHRLQMAGGTRPTRWLLRHGAGRARRFHVAPASACNAIHPINGGWDPPYAMAVTEYLNDWKPFPRNVHAFPEVTPRRAGLTRHTA